jgi:hypothetical protein
MNSPACVPPTMVLGRLEIAAGTVGAIVGGWPCSRVKTSFRAVCTPQLRGGFGRVAHWTTTELMEGR